jgi:hypothetical protein
MNRSDRKRRSSCVDDEVCSNSVRGKRKNLKKLLTRPTSLEIRRYQDCLPDLAPAGCFRVGDASATMLLVRAPGKFWWFELTFRISATNVDN